MPEEYKHPTGEILSDELSEKEKKYIVSMHDYKEFVQIPILTEKIILLSKRIENFDRNTAQMSKILIVLTAMLFIVAIEQFIATIAVSNLSSWIRIGMIVVFFIGLYWVMPKLAKLLTKLD